MFVQMQAHESSRAMLSLMTYPGLVESQSAEELEAIFTRDGYEKQAPGTVTMGWGHVVSDAEEDYSDSPTISTVATRDGKVVQFAVGPQGSYSFSVLVEDINNPTAEEKAEILQHEEIKAEFSESHPHIVAQFSEGPKYIAFVERCKLDLV